MKRLGQVEMQRESDVAKDIIKDFNEAIKKFMESPPDMNGLYKARYNLGVFLRNIGCLEESTDELKKAADQGEKPSACNQLGLTLFKRGFYEDAVKYFTKSVAQNSTAVHHNNLGLAYYHISHLQDALKHFNLAVQLDSKDPNIFFNRGNVYLN